MTNTERKILTEIHQHGPVTYLDCERLDIDIYTWLDVIAKLQWLGWIIAESKEAKTRNGSPRMILHYSFSKRFKNMFEFKSLMP
ncbi:hypothetical protein [Gracilimonas sediminicola]|uniref:hypothetical protein n=1 Tax=Gracilimonas sediminicola TaxID=2952158 RepID=UPI0038D3ED0A